MKMALPVWQVSVDETNPVATNNFSGVLVFVFDATALVEKVTKGIRSGKTGYAWVIDNRGTFLYHPEKEFIGKNAFEARKEKKPTISFTLINEIQKKMILRGEEGTSWYISGWHRGREGEMKKLIAYTPITLTETGAQLWSVAVVAPISEVEDAIHSIHVQQISLQAIVVVAILFGGLTIMTLMVNWSKSLENEVGRKTIEYKKSEQRYRSLVEHAEDIIFTTDLEGNFLSINAFGERFFRKPRGSIIGRNVNELFASSAGEMILAAIRDIVSEKRGKQVTFLVRVGEREYWLNSNFRRLLDQDGNVYAILGVARDMTDRTKMEEQSFYTEKMASLGTLSAGVAHEINNPLAIILGFTDILKEKYAYDPEISDILSTMERQGLKAKKVVDNLLTFARRKEHADVEVDMNACIREVLSVLSNNLLVNKISLKELDLFPELPRVKGDPDELQQVLFNIINNAVYAMKSSGGILSIATQVSDDEKDVEIRISDTGPGIVPEYRARIFDPLFTTKKVGDGTGLGLSVSYGIISRHHGIITFTTQTKDESNQTGTTFFITIPAILKQEGEHAA
jgi:PAS domain S-box-containing protein